MHKMFHTWESTFRTFQYIYYIEIINAVYYILVLSKSLGAYLIRYSLENEKRNFFFLNIYLHI